MTNAEKQDVFIAGIVAAENFLHGEVISDKEAEALAQKAYPTKIVQEPRVYVVSGGSYRLIDGAVQRLDDGTGDWATFLGGELAAMVSDLYDKPTIDVEVDDDGK